VKEKTIKKAQPAVDNGPDLIALDTPAPSSSSNFDTEFTFFQSATPSNNPNTFVTSPTPQQQKSNQPQADFGKP
jgi:hypothetical protein